MASNPAPRLTEEQYLTIERAAEFKSQFLNGEMYAMSGVSVRHADLQGNVYAELHTLLRGGPCRVFTSDLRGRVSATGLYTYPDVTVVCGPLLLADANQDILLNPVTIFEVLSKSTESYDRGLKFQHYRTIESLKDYILVDQNTIRIEQYTRQTDDTWTLRDHQQPADELKINCIGVSIPLARIYERVEFSAS